jgi:hypothetical protein
MLPKTRSAILAPFSVPPLVFYWSFNRLRSACIQHTPPPNPVTKIAAAWTLVCPARSAQQELPFIVKQKRPQLD